MVVEVVQKVNDEGVNTPTFFCFAEEVGSIIFSERRLAPGDWSNKCLYVVD